MTKLAYSVREAAEQLGCSTWSIYRAVSNGEIPVVPFVGRRVLIPAAALERVVDQTATFKTPPDA